MKAYNLAKIIGIPLISLYLTVSPIIAYGQNNHQVEAKKAYTNSENTKKDLMRKVLEGIIEDNFDGMMLELKDRKQSTELNSYKLDLENAQILTSHQSKDDDRIIIYIRDFHGEALTQQELMPVQERIYGTLDELHKKNNINLLVLEGSLCSKEITRSELGKPKEFKDKHEALEHFIYGGTAYEYMNDDKIKTFGAEEEVLLTIGYKHIFPPDSEVKRWLSKVIVLDKRSEVGVEKTLKYMEETNTKIAVLIFGAAHTRSIVQSLKKENVSYIVMQPNGADDLISKVQSNKDKIISETLSKFLDSNQK